jgi:predicted HTH transcriptional regulator
MFIASDNVCQKNVTQNVTQEGDNVTQDDIIVTQENDNVRQDVSQENVTPSVTQEGDNVTQGDILFNQNNGNVRQGNVTQVTHNKKSDTNRNIIFQKITELIREDNKITSSKMAERLGVTARTIKRYLKVMPNVKYIGSGYSGHWEIV